MQSENRDMDYEAVEIMQLAQHAFFRRKNHRCYKRIFLAAVAIKATLLKVNGQQNFAEEYISCLKMYFVATTDVFLSVFEVKSLLYVCFTMIKRLRLYDDFCQEFDKLMPECPTRLEPRKLTDLARCQVRKNLSQCNLSLPEALKKLNLPKRIKSFILGDFIHIKE